MNKKNANIDDQKDDESNGILEWFIEELKNDKNELVLSALQFRF